MNSRIRTQPIYLLILPFYFVFHGYTENYDLLPIPDILILFIVYLVSVLVLTGLIFLLLRNISKAAFISFLMFSFYFFFGAIYDRIVFTSPQSFFAKYTVIIGCFLVILFVSFIYLYRYKRSLSNFNYAWNVFFVLLLLVDGIWLISKIANPQRLQNTSFDKEYSICDTCTKPDIYLIIPDEYAGDSALSQTMNFNNSEFKSELNKRGFYTPESLSNYNYTPFSVASLLNMEYLQDLEGSNTNASDLSKCYKTIRYNKVFQFLKPHGYELYNYSTHDIHDQPSMVKESILPGKTKFITAQTLFYRLEGNFLFNMADRFGSTAKKKRLMITYNSNVKAFNTLNNSFSIKSGNPRFVYTHLIMPHYPYYFDKNGVFRNYSGMEDIDEKNLAHYVEYLQYTNKLLLNLIDTIIAKSKNPPIILLLSDHGFREYPRKVHSKYMFINKLAVYLPGRNYSSFYNNISNVNVFRALFNSQFQQKFPMLNDSTILIRQ